MTREEIIRQARLLQYSSNPKELAEFIGMIADEEMEYPVEPQELDEAPKKKLRKVCNLCEELKDEPIEEKLAELRKIRAEKDRLDEAADNVRPRVKEIFDSLPKSDIDEERHNRVEFSLIALEAFALLFYQAGAEWMAGQGVSMQVTDDTEWSEVDLVVHKNVCEGSIIQIRKK